MYSPSPCPYFHPKREKNDLKKIVTDYFTWFKCKTCTWSLLFSVINYCEISDFFFLLKKMPFWDCFGPVSPLILVTDRQKYSSPWRYRRAWSDKRTKAQIYIVFNDLLKGKGKMSIWRQFMRIDRMPGLTVPTFPQTRLQTDTDRLLFFSDQSTISFGFLERIFWLSVIHTMKWSPAKYLANRL